MTYKEAITFLYQLQQFGMKFGLQGVETLLNELGNPHRRLTTIHIAGTNGKGSTAAMIAAMFTAAGYRTGLYTSPHILRFEERIRIDGKPIPARTVAGLTSEIRPIVTKQRNTFFEAVTALAFRYFADEKVDIAIVETGLGGRLDATNVVKPLVSVITTIGLEHAHILGNTLQKIAYEKGGIIKPNIPLITGVTSKEALQEIKSIAERNNASLIKVSKGQVEIHCSSLQGSDVSMKTRGGYFKNLHIELPGIHQILNACMAVEAVLKAAELGRFLISEKNIRDGLSHTYHYTGFYGRLSVVKRKPLMLMDVAHNPDAMAALVQSLQMLGCNAVSAVFGVMRDKDCARISEALKPICKELIAVAPKTERAASTSDIVKIFHSHGIPAVEEHSVVSGLRRALKEPASAPILITGSHFVCGEAIAWINGKKYLTINQ